MLVEPDGRKVAGPHFEEGFTHPGGCGPIQQVLQQSPAEADGLMRQHNPAFIPRNHNVEEALTAATTNHDLSVMERLLDVLASPYDHTRDLPAFSAPGPGERRYVTFCGT